MELNLLDPKVSDEQVKSATLEDIARGVKGLADTARLQKEETEKGFRTKGESLQEFEKRLNELGQQIEKIRRDQPPPDLVSGYQGEFASRPGGLFRRGTPPMNIKSMLALSPQSSILRGNDAELVKDFQDAWDATVLKYYLEMSVRGEQQAANCLARAKATPDFKRLEKLVEYAGYEKTLIHPESGGIAEPLTWNLMSGQVLDIVRVGLRVANQVVQVALDHTDQTIPANRGDCIGVRGGAATTDPPPRANITSPIPPVANMGAVAFGNVKFSVQDVLTFLWWSDRAVQESVITLVPYLRNAIAYGLRRAIDRACMSGDIQGTTQGNHMDDHANAFTIQDARTLWNGLRRLGTNQMVQSNGASVDATDIRAMRKRLGIYGLESSELVCWMPPAQLFDMIADAATLTLEKFGPQAVVKTGQLAAIDNIALIPTEWIPTDQGVDANQGVSVNGGTATSIVMANVTRFMLGMLGSTTIEATRMAPMLTTILQTGAQADFVPIEAIDGSKIFASGVAPVTIWTEVV